MTMGMSTTCGERSDLLPIAGFIVSYVDMHMDTYVYGYPYAHMRNTKVRSQTHHEPVTGPLQSGQSAFPPTVPVLASTVRCLQASRSSVPNVLRSSVHCTACQICVRTHVPLWQQREGMHVRAYDHVPVCMCSKRTCSKRTCSKGCSKGCSKRIVPSTRCLPTRRPNPWPSGNRIPTCSGLSSRNGTPCGTAHRERPRSP